MEHESIKFKDWSQYQREYRKRNPAICDKHRFTTSVRFVARYCADHPEAVPFMKEQLSQFFKGDSL